MAFQFLCPEGHLLQADESQAGQPSQCPYCGCVFLVPEPTRAPPERSAAPGRVSQQAEVVPPFGPPPDDATAFPGIRIAPELGRRSSGAEVPSQFNLLRAADLPMVHVICPSGHELETPREMLGQEALCPFCQAQFWLRLEDSIEYRQEKAKEEEWRAHRTGQIWLRWSIVAAVVVVLGLLAMIAISVLQ